jgi:hypothetical protein
MEKRGFASKVIYEAARDTGEGSWENYLSPLSQDHFSGKDCWNFLFLIMPAYPRAGFNRKVPGSHR